MHLLKRGSVEEGVESSAKVKKDLKFVKDPAMLSKLGIREPMKGEPFKLNDHEKIFTFQLRNDIDLIKANSKPFKEQVDEYLKERREESVTFRNISSSRPLGKLGMVNEVSVKRQDQLWRESGVTYGLLAHRYFGYWRKNLPGGPSKEYLYHREQNKIDYSLWDDIRFGRIEPTLEELRKKHYEEKKKLKELEEEEKLKDLEAAKTGKQRESEEMIKEKNRIQEEINKRATAISRGNFAELRKLPTRAEFAQSMKNWDRGHNHQFNGFPLVDGHDEDFKSAGRDVAGDAGENGTYSAGVTFKENTDKYIPHDGRGEFLNAFYQWMQNVNAKRCKEYLTKVKRERKEAKRAAIKAAKDLLKKTAKTKAAEEKVIEDDRLKKASNPNGLSELELFWRKVTVDYFTNGESDYDQWKGTDIFELKSNEIRKSEFLHLLKDEHMQEVDHMICPPIYLPPDEKDEDDSSVITDFKDNFFVVVCKDYARRLTHFRERFRKNAKVYMEAASAAVVGDDGGDGTNNDSTSATTKTSPSKLYSTRLAKSNILTEQLKNASKNNGDDDGANDPSQPSAEKGGGPALVLFPETQRANLYKEHYKKKFKVAGDKFILDLKNNFYALTGQDELIVQPDDPRKKNKAADENNDDDEENNDMNSEDLDMEEDNNKPSMVRRQHEPKNFTEKAEHYWKEFKYLAKIEERPDPKDKKKNIKFQQKVEYKLRHGPENNELMDIMFRVRRVEKAAETKWIRLYNKWFSGNLDRDVSDDYTGDKLVTAAKAGNYRRVMDLLEDEESALNANSLDNEGITALYGAVMLVIANEAYGAKTDDEFITIWQRIKRFFARQSEDEKLDLVIRLLLYKDANINHIKVEKDPSGDGMGLMHLACAAGSLDTVKWLVNKGCDINQKSSRLNKTPLMLAAGHNHLKLCLWLLRNGCQPFINDQDRIGESPLHYAALCNNPDLSTCMMLYGSIPNLRAHGPPPMNEPGAGKTAFEKANQIRNFVTANTVRMFTDPYTTLRKYMDFQEYFYFQQGKENANGENDVEAYEE